MATILGVDVGGTGIKAALVDTATGELLSDRHRVATPADSTPVNMAAAVKELLSEFDYTGTVGCCFPSVIVHGKARTAGNIDKSWRGTRVDAEFEDATGHPFVVLNDADAAGIAEMRLGAGAGLSGLVLMVTIGTGIGSGMFYDGQLIPNLELGHMPGKDGRPIERYAGNRARKTNDLSWDEWGLRLNYFFERTVRVCSPDHFILGGGVSKKFDLYKHAIKVPTPIHVARFQNNAGIIGAALAVHANSESALAK
jgi:polyphosphate glucokinase